MKFKQFLPSLAFLLVVAILGLAFVFLPKATYSVSEKRLLADPPTFSIESLTDGTLSEEIDSYVSDHFPARDLFVAVQAYTEWLTGRGGASDVYHGRDGYLIGAPAAADAAHVQKNVARFADFAARHELDGTLMIVPSTGYVMNDKLPANHRAYADDAMFDAAVQSLGTLSLVDLREPFATAKADTQLYYKTDHHLTAAGSYEMYKTYAAAKGLAVHDDYRVETVDGFYGTMYAKSGYRLTAPDTVELWHNDNLTVDVAIYDAGTTPTKQATGVFFSEHLSADDKYPVYLDGNHALVTIHNPHAATDRKLLIVKDSFAHCVTGFLAEQYEEIVMIDLRYYLSDAGALVNEHGITDALFLYGMENLSTESANSSWLEPMG